MSPAAHHALERDAGEIDGTHHHSRSLRERKKEKTRAGIHTAAVRLTMERGLADVSIHAICSAADVSSRTFFNYFPSKVAAVIGSGDLTVSESRRSRLSAERPELARLSRASLWILAAGEGAAVRSRGRSSLSFSGRCRAMRARRLRRRRCRL